MQHAHWRYALLLVSQPDTARWVQGDVMLAENLVKLLGTKLVASFLHQVTPLHPSPCVVHLPGIRIGIFYAC